MPTLKLLLPKDVTDRLKASAQAATAKMLATRSWELYEPTKKEYKSARETLGLKCRAAAAKEGLRKGVEGYEEYLE